MDLTNMNHKTRKGILKFIKDKKDDFFKIAMDTIQQLTVNTTQGPSGPPNNATAFAQLGVKADVLKGKLRPPDCPLFGTACTPDHAVGPCMVSSEGTCSAYFKYIAT